MNKDVERFLDEYIKGRKNKDKKGEEVCQGTRSKKKKEEFDDRKGKGWLGRKERGKHTGIKSSCR